MNRPTTLPTLLIGLLLLAAATVSAQQAPDQRLVVPLSNPSEPAVLEASLVRGTITVEAYDGSEMIIDTTHGSGGEDDDEESESETDEEGRGRAAGLRRIPSVGGGLVIEESDNRVEVSSESWHRRVQLRIQVPRRTSLRLATVNGGALRVSGVEGEHELQNTNGGISAIDVRGSVVANTTNGEVVVKMLDITPDKAMSFTTWNGDIDVTLPGDLSAVLLMNPGRGDVYTDFDMKLQPTKPKIETSSKRKGYKVEVKQEVRATVGAGGPEIHFRTFNGSLYVRKLD